ncbi:substrate-binding domain-containing protein [Pedomonas mirosovicensis]|uniref:substrate-binding domain-containing protein n=1 Tax=Pedomonas mirosovicensis TaxID=2908641 RepID=UPI0021679EA7|nr:substrate-binding domain-containing protein [Pedomonas mirosovicensis]
MIAVATATLTAACADNAEARDQIRVVGSSTVYPFTTAVAEQFARSNPKFKAPIVESTGTGGGLKLFCAGVGANTPDIANASRRIKASEIKQCAQNGVTKIIEIQVGLDGLVLAQAKNGPAMELTRADVYKALAAQPLGKKNTARTWKDVNAKLPANKIELIGPPPTSGTRDSLNELLMLAGCKTFPQMKKMEEADKKKAEAMCVTLREDGAYIEAGENDNLIVQKLVANPQAVGAFGYSFLEENQDKLRGIKVDGVEPTYANIQTFKYPAARALYIYVKAQHIGPIPGIKEFLAEYSKESTWGPRGYLARRGLVASTDKVRAEAAKIAKTLKPLDPASVK